MTIHVWFLIAAIGLYLLSEVPAYYRRKYDPDTWQHLWALHYDTFLTTVALVCGVLVFTSLIWGIVVIALISFTVAGVTQGWIKDNPEAAIKLSMNPKVKSDKEKIDKK